MNKEDLNHLSQLLKFQITAETREQESEADAKLRRFKDRIMFLSGILIVVSAFIFFSWRIIMDHGDHLSITVESNIVIGFISYLVGRKTV